MKEKEALDKLCPIPTTDETRNFLKDLYKEGYLILSPEELEKVNSITMSSKPFVASVDEEFIQEAINYIAEYPTYKRLEKKLIEAGVRVA